LRRGQGRPHVSLARCDATNPSRLAAAVSGFACGASAFTVEFGALGVFAPEAWVFLAPVASEQLIHFHARMHEWLAELVASTTGLGPIHQDAYTPGRWVPHCTLTTRLEPALAAHAVQLCLCTDLPRAATIERIGLTHFPPVAELHSFPLEGRP
jgi:2'-5' RNA ligase